MTIIRKNSVPLPQLHGQLKKYRNGVKLNVQILVSKKSSKSKNKTLPLGAPFVKLKGSKKLQHYVEEAKESRARGNESDNSYQDVDFEEILSL